MLSSHRYVKSIAQLFEGHIKDARNNCRSYNTEEKQVLSFWTGSIRHAGGSQRSRNKSA